MWVILLFKWCVIFLFNNNIKHYILRINQILSLILLPIEVYDNQAMATKWFNGLRAKLLHLVQVDFFYYDPEMDCNSFSFSREVALTKLVYIFIEKWKPFIR